MVKKNKCISIYPNIENLDVKTSDGRNISLDKIWRDKGKIYILDDPDIEYQWIYVYPLLESSFYPISGEIFTTSKPTIYITCQEIVKITKATFGSYDISDQLSTSDNQTFIFKAKSDLPDGTYIFSIILQDENGENFTLEASYEIETNNEKQKEKDEETPWLIIAFRIIIIIILIMVFLFKIGHLYFEFEDKDTESRKEFNRKEKED